jgi:hypothetical protein
LPTVEARGDAVEDLFQPGLELPLQVILAGGFAGIALERWIAACAEQPRHLRGQSGPGLLAAGPVSLVHQLPQADLGAGSTVHVGGDSADGAHRRVGVEVRAAQRGERPLREGHPVGCQIVHRL